MRVAGRLRRGLATARLRVLSARVDRAVRGGRLDAALVLARRACALADRQPDGLAAWQWRGTLHNTAGWVALQRGDLTAAEAALTRSLRIEESIDPRSAETALRLSNLAAVSAHRGELDRALERYERALVLGAAVDDTSLAHAGDLTSRGVVLARAGRDVEADEHHARALAVLERWHPGSSELAGALTNRATLLLNRGGLDEAMVLFRRAFDIESGFDAGSTATATAWSNLGLVHDALGDSDRALACFTRALTIDEARAPDAPDTAVDHNNIAAVLLAVGRPDDAVPHLAEALRIDHLAAPGSAGAAADWLNLGYAHHLAGRLDEAADHYQRALGIDAAIARSSREVALDLTNLGAVEHQRGRSDDALHLLGQAEEILDRLGLPAALARCRINRAAVLHETGRHDEAIDVARRACAAAEETRGRAGGATSREQVFALQQSPFAALITWLCDRGADGDADDAFAVAEAATARSLADLLGERRRPSGDPDLPELSGAGRAGPAESMAALPGTLLLRYTDGEGRLHVWAGRDGAGVLRPLDLDADRLAELVDRAVAVHRRGEPGGEGERAAATELAELLLDPVPERLWAGARRLLVVPVDSLFLLPFELLPRGAVLLGDIWEIGYAPSLSVLLHGIAPPSAADRAPFVGYAAADEHGSDISPLPGAVTEVRRVAAALGAAPSAVRLRPTPATVAATAGATRHVHFATHGVLDDADPLRSGFVCAPDHPGGDPVLRAAQIMDLTLDADLVVCSACGTGLGRLRRGEGVVGLSRAFLLAGARCLVLTLWPVPDLPTRRLMVAFAEQLRDGYDPATALHAARTLVRRRHPRTFASPWTWAGFVVVGAGWGPPPASAGPV